MPGFTATSPENFLLDYLDLCDQVSMGEVAEWIYKNIECIKETMFFNPKIDWDQIDPCSLIILRACVPKDVFTPKAKTEYIEQVKDRKDLAEIADALFGQDEGLITRLPKGYEDIAHELVGLMNLTYIKGIRLEDARVTLMFSK